MSNYTKTTDFEAKDSLPTGDSGKIIRGAEFETEFDAISTAIATKADTAGPTFTGTLTFETISDGIIGVTAFVDEDDMSSDSATLVPTQQSVKAYVDSQVTAQDLDFQADSGGALSIDLDSESLTFTGGTGIDTSGSGNAVTFAIDSTVATLTGTQTLTNKTLTSPDVNTPDIDGGTIDGATIATSDITVGTGKTLDVSSGTLTLADDQISGDKVEGGTIASTTITSLASTTVDTTNLEVTNIKAKDGTSAGSIADSTGVVTLASSVLTTTDINGGTIDGATIGGTTAAAGSFTTVSATGNITVDGTVDGRDVATDGTKLDTVETNADVTDTTNVTAAGAVMDSELTNETAVKSLDQGVATTDSPTFAGLTTTADVSFGDNDKAVFGAGSDLQIYHDGTTSIIKDAGTGELQLHAENNLRLQNLTGSTYALFSNGAAASLYYNGSAKLATTSTGIDVTGTVTADGLTLSAEGDQISIPTSAGFSGVITTGDTVFGNAFEFKNGNGIVLVSDTNDSGATGGVDATLIARGSSATKTALFDANGDISFYEDTGTTAKLFWDASAESLGIGTSSVAGALHVESANNYSGTDFEDNPHLLISNGTPTNHTAVLMFQSSGTGVANKRSGITGGNYYSNKHGLSFLGDLSGKDRSATPDMFIDASGQVGIGTSSPSVALEVDGTIKASGNGKLQIADDTEGSTFEFNVGGDGALEIYDGATERMQIDSSGRVGIGTSSPAQDLHIREDSGDCNLLIDSANGASQIFFGDDESVNVGKIGYNHASNFMAFSANGTEAMRIDSSGNLLVGTTDTFPGDGDTNTGIALTATGSAAFSRDGFRVVSVNRNSSDGTLIEFNKNGSEVGSIATNSSRFELDGSGNPVRMKAGTSNIQVNNNTHISFDTAGNEAARFDTSGNLLVGKTANNDSDAGVVLRATGEGSFVASGQRVAYFNRLSSDGEIITLRKDGSSVGSIASVGGADIKVVFSNDGDQYITGNSASNYLTFSSANAERMRLDSSGNFMVGTTTQLGRLTVNNGGNYTGLHVRQTSTSVNQVCGIIRNDYVTGGQTGKMLRFEQGTGGEVGSVTSTVTATAYNTSSDQRLKDNIVDAPSASDDIDAIQVRSFDWKADGSHQKYGMVAQELQSVAPEAVTGDADSDDMMGVDYSKLVPMMMKEIQSLRARVAQLEGAN
jgi:hypothetical protein